MVTPKLSADGKTLTCRVRGDLTSTRSEACAAQISAIVRNYSRGRWKTLSLDLNSARMIDSAGLNVILGAVNLMEEQGRSVKVLVSSPAVQRALHLTRIDRKVEIVMRTRRPKRAMKS